MVKSKNKLQIEMVSQILHYEKAPIFIDSTQVEGALCQIDDWMTGKWGFEPQN